MNWLLAFVLMASMGGWGLHNIGDGEAVIVNNLGRDITCYIYYFDDDFRKRYVRRGSTSRPFPSQDIAEVECY